MPKDVGVVQGYIDVFAISLVWFYCVQMIFFSKMYRINNFKIPEYYFYRSLRKPHHWRVGPHCGTPLHYITLYNNIYTCTTYKINSDLINQTSLESTRRRFSKRNTQALAPAYSHRLYTPCYTFIMTNIEGILKVVTRRRFHPKGESI